jgi:hypothetical protein
MVDGDLKVSQARLWALIEERCQPGADVAELDRRIGDLFGERWAVMFTDLSGFSRRVAEFGILHFLQVIHEQRKILVSAAALEALATQRDVTFESIGAQAAHDAQSVPLRLATG